METKEAVKSKDTEVIERLEKLGFKTASRGIIEKKAKAKKLMIAYEHYRYVRQEKINAFNMKLSKESYNWDGMRGYKILDFTPISDYPGAPPAEVLEALEVAQGRQCFDSYEVAYIKAVHDPLLFGRVEGCSDRFFIAGWDSDILITDLIKENEG